jgi:hypothetical protein
MKHVELHIDQKLSGISVDVEGLHNRRDWLLEGLTDYRHRILEHADIAPHIDSIEEELCKALLEKEPEKFLKKKERPPEPAQYTKAGKVSKTWENWVRNASKYTADVVSKNWLNWRDKYQAAMNGDDPDYRFNLQSGHHLAKLYYEKLGYPVRVLTEAGQPGTGIKALKHFGESGNLLIERSYIEKELGYIEDYIERTLEKDTIHPSFRMPGTKTGRLSSNQPNLQQLPKSKAVMSLWRARPGNVFVDIDFAALESMVAAEMSGDPNLFELYGDGKPENDIHLFVAAQTPGLREAILATGYTPVNPAPGTVSKAKKECKKQRNITKTVVYACQFGAGVDKVLSTLENDDVFLSREEVEVIHGGYWKTFSRLKEYRWELEREWRKNRGYILNGMGRPMCVTEDYKHDLLNRCIQSTGHDILVRYVGIHTQLLTNMGIPWIPVILDLHDASTVEVPEECGALAAQAFLLALDALNQELGCTIKLKGVPTIGKTLADVKEPEE